MGEQRRMEAFVTLGRPMTSTTCCWCVPLRFWSIYPPPKCSGTPFLVICWPVVRLSLYAGTFLAPNHALGRLSSSLLLPTVRHATLRCRTPSSSPVIALSRLIYRYEHARTSGTSFWASLPIPAHSFAGFGTGVSSPARRSSPHSVLGSVTGMSDVSPAYCSLTHCAVGSSPHRI